MMAALMPQLIIGAAVCVLVAGLIAAIRYMARGTPCAECYGTGLIITPEGARVSGFRQPDPTCPDCRGTGRAPENRSR